jgi:3-methyladenine DNA glycosylase/8-oxoguanine DNA glycosylase
VQNIKKQRQNQLQYIQEAPSPLSADQIRLIQESWQRILPIKEQAAELFYARLFELDPSVKKLFKGKLDYQGDKLMTTLDVVVNSLDCFCYAQVSRKVTVRLKTNLLAELSSVSKQK